MSNITLSAGVRQNLLSLQNTADLMATTQNRLATGKKVNSALDNPTNFFTAGSLQARSNDLSTLLDGMSNGIKTLEAADNGITSISKTIQSMQALVRQARADKTEATGAAATNAVVNATGAGSVDASAADVTFEVNGEAVTLNAAGGAAGVYDSAALASAINTQVGTTAGVNATVVGGNLRITSTGTAGAADAVTVDTFSAGTDATDLGFAATTATANGTDAGAGGTESEGRAGLRAQFNELINQLNAFSEDASFNGINLLAGDKLTISFDEKGENTIEVMSSLGDGTEGPTSAVDATNLGIASQTDWSSDANLDTLLTGLGTSLTTLRSQASSFGTNLSVVQNRTDFTKSMMNTLQTGADKLVLADTNEEAANMLALQTRQQLSSTALSLASQADQAALRLF
jgi:flagellin-like hook-associated protein FlgL